MGLAGVKELGVSLPATGSCQQLFNAIVAALDHSESSRSERPQHE